MVSVEDWIRHLSAGDAALRGRLAVFALNRAAGMRLPEALLLDFRRHPDAPALAPLVLEDLAAHEPWLET